MRTLALSTRAVTSGVALALLVACGGLRQAQDDMPPSTRVPGTMNLLGAKGRDLLYVSVGYLPDRGVYVYAYPSLKPLGSLGGVSTPLGECVDAAGDVFIVDGYNYDVLEYAHGGTSSIATIYAPNLIPNGCSVDPTSGKLAVSGVGPTTKHVTGIVYVYAHERRRGWRLPKIYGISTMNGGYFCGYDNTGNLYVDGISISREFGIVELPKGGDALTSVTLNQAIKQPGQVQWDGHDLAVGDAGVSPSVIYRFAVSGSSGTEVGSAILKGSVSVGPFWIQRNKVIGLDGASRTTHGVGLWPYPLGGDRNRSIKLSQPSGAVVSPGK